eukprot:GHUV01002844.1.p1 GENE.GHUV01002844.1~~GHUV01002844.1.p1  ORF type:complete len:196 (+),score=40.90 GHUV01002844.1:109-696(+)
MLCQSQTVAYKSRANSFSGRVSRAVHPQACRRIRLHSVVRAAPEVRDIEDVADLIAAQPLDDEQKSSLSMLVETLGIPLGTAKQMVFKKRGLLKLTQQEILDRMTQVADIVGVTTDQAIEMITIQPGLLFDTQRNAEALAMGIRAICYELKAPKDEIVDLILKNQSVLHGREMHLSVADIAHLAMLREPKGRIAE